MSTTNNTGTVPMFLCGDGRLLSHHLSTKYGVSLGIRQCQRLVHQFGFRRRKPRPLIAKADPVLQQEYKKTHPISKKK